MTSTQHPAVVAFLAARQREEQSSSQVPEFFPLKSFVQLYIKSNCSIEHFCELFYNYLKPLSAPPDNGKPYIKELDHYDFKYIARHAKTTSKIVQQIFFELYYNDYVAGTFTRLKGRPRVYTVPHSSQLKEDHEYTDPDATD